MATVGNLFVNIGASTAGLERGAQKAKATVKSLKTDLTGALGNIPGIGPMVAPFERLVELIQKGMGGTSKGLEAARVMAETQKAIARAESAHQKAVEGVAKAKQGLASATDAAARAQNDLNAGAKLTRLLAERDKSAEKAAKTLPHLQKAAAAYQAQESRINAATFRGAAYNSMLQKQQGLLAKLNVLKAQQAKIQGDLDAKQGKVGRVQSVLQSRGVTVRPDGGVDLKGLQSAAQASADKVAKAQERVRGAMEKAKESADHVQRLKDQLKSAGEVAKQFSKLSVASGLGIGLIAVGALAAVGGLISLTSAMSKMASELNDQATALGVMPSQLQRLRDSYVELGVAPGVAETAMQRLEATLQEAVEGSEDAREKFSRLGLDINALSTQDSVQALDTVMTRLRQLGSQGEKMKSLRDLFGKGGMGMAAAVNATGEELDHVAKVAASLTLPDAMIQQLDGTNDQLHALGRAFDNVKTILASAFAPAVENIAISLREMMTADFNGMLGGMQSIALVVAIIADVLATAVNTLRMVWNIVQAIAGLLLTAVVGGLAAILKIVQAVVYAVEWLSGASHAISDSVGGAAAAAWDTTKQLAKGAGEDVVEAFNAGVDAIKPDNAIAVINGIAQGYDKTKHHIESQPIAVNIVDKEAQQKLKDYDKAMAALQDRVATLGMTERQKELFNLQKLTKNPVALDNADQLLYQIEQYEKQQKIMQDTKAIMDDLQQQADTALMSERQKLVYKLQQAGADKEQIKTALALNAAIAERTQLAEGQEAWKTFLQGLDKSLFEATASREQQIRKLAEAAGLLGKDLDAAVANALKMESAIAEAEKAKQAQADVASTLESMQEEVRRAEIGDRAFAREQFVKQLEAAKAPDMAAKLAEFDRLQALMPADVAKGSKDQQALVDSIDTAFGTFKTGSSVSERMLTESQTQTDLLDKIATSTASAAAQASVGRSAAATGGAPFGDDANKYLAEIAANTSAFVGLMT